MNDYMDVGGRATQGGVAENTRLYFFAFSVEKAFYIF
jgi:hypothetical protein